MLVVPRVYKLAQIPDKGTAGSSSTIYGNPTWQERHRQQRNAFRMLLVHQVGSVKVGEVVRYTLTYTPSADRIIPHPSTLHVKIKNTSAIALRAAYLRGPYTLHVAAYPSQFRSNQKLEFPLRDGIPEYEPQLKAGGSWTAKLSVPPDIRGQGTSPYPSTATIHNEGSVTWIIEISSQIVFSASATVHFEVIVARDEKALDLGLVKLGGTNKAGQGKLDAQHDGHHDPHVEGGVYSKAVKLQVEDTAALWNKPPLPHPEDRLRVSHPAEKRRKATSSGPSDSSPPGVGNPDLDSDQVGEEDSGAGATSQKKIHLVILTHGLHSNLGADLLYLKESIDEAAKEAKEAKKRHRQRQSRGKRVTEEPGTDSEDEEGEVVVRGFPGNAVRTERGIKYMGKRLARYVLWMTFPEQPFLPVKRSTTKSIAMSFGGQAGRDEGHGVPAHLHSSIQRKSSHKKRTAYKVQNISFIGHSLGGLVQTYAVAYIQKHSPHFFDEIKPINFVALATPFLGLSNENPLYVKFALDFGLVGRTGQDLGLTWRPPTLARSGWSAIVGGLGSASDRAARDQPDPGSKPLLRILPTGPAHKALRFFRNRTVYSNVVNDGIVPLRTSCLLFLDWSGLDRVEKARRENGLVGTVAEWGWNELMGANSSSVQSQHRRSGEGVVVAKEAEDEESGGNTPISQADGASVPQPTDADLNDVHGEQTVDEPEASQFLARVGGAQPENGATVRLPKGTPAASESDGISSFFAFLRPHREKIQQTKASRVYKRGQTMRVSGSDTGSPLEAQSVDALEGDAASASPSSVTAKGIPAAEDSENVMAPPRTTIFESAGDILSPPLPTTDFLIDPSKRPRTIFHDRVYHPEDIPPEPVRRRGAGRSSSGLQDVPPSPAGEASSSSSEHGANEAGSMKIEEKIARAYHRDLAWRKVLVRLEPDAHNNMIVRRKFANAYGWPVIKHLVDTHFSFTEAALTRDDDEPGTERAKSVEKGVGTQGEELKGDIVGPPIRSVSESREASDAVGDLNVDMKHHATHLESPIMARHDSAQWSDGIFEVTDDDDDDDEDFGVTTHRSPTKSDRDVDDAFSPVQKGTSDAEISDFLGRPPPQSGADQNLPLRAAAKPLPLNTSSAAAVSAPIAKGRTTQAGLIKSIGDESARNAGEDNSTAAVP
ncbi:MAG: hypothetical protein M1825_000769 [Sarcosagium campestre]|nr:MAG: hypothetical protein M1825_000769 [Sarcosagium campestre]